MKYKNIYVAASSQHVGKTTSTLGLVSCLIQKNINVGYCKPVGQKFLDLNNLYVDKDTLLFADLIKFEISPEHHSPVILPGSVVKNAIEDPINDFRDKIIAAGKYLNEQHDLTIFEGTGHPGVGSVVGLSNAQVAKALDASVVMILEGGIGSTVDMFHMCSAVFREQNVPIIGVIINKIRPDKLESVGTYLGQYFTRQGIPLLGLVPYDEFLAFPLMSSVVQSIKGTVEYNEENLDNNRVENILAGSLVDLKELYTFQNHLIVSSIKTIDRAIHKVEAFCDARNYEECPISGIIITGEGKFTQSTYDYIMTHKIPVIRTNYDTLGAVIKISKIEVKINRRTPWKVQRAIELINENVDLEKILIPV
jgi:dethiobiotin synthetase